MNSHLKIGLLTICLALVAWGCKLDDPMVIDGAGVWNVLSKKTLVEENGVVVKDETLTQNLGQWEFERNGRGFFIYSNTLRDTVIWEEYPSEQKLIIYSDGPWINATITDRTDNSMTLDWENEADEWQKHIHTECTVMIERAK